MPRSKKPKDELRRSFVGARLLTRQRSKLQRGARSEGVSISSYLGQLIDGSPAKRKPVEPPPDLVPYLLLAQWQRVGNNINQIARSLNRGRSPDQDWIVGAMRELFLLMIEDQLSRRYALRHGLVRIEQKLSAGR